MSIIINRNIIFLDSLQFCKESLDNLTSNLSNDHFKHLMSDKLETLKKKKSHIHMNGEILMENLIIKNYHLKNVFIHQ